MSKCNICNRERETFVASSALGAVSFAYCNECLNREAEQKGLIQGTIEMLNGDVADWVLNLTYFDTKTETYISAEVLMEDYNNGVRLFDFDI